MNEPKDEASTALLGMWIFLATECLLFSTLLYALALYRHLYPVDFSQGTQHLSLFIGSLNTGILLTSSLTMALSVHYSKENQSKVSKKLLLTTAVLGVLFVSLKGLEYRQHYEEGLMPAIHWIVNDVQFPHEKLFFVLYFFTTALHALHLTIGIGLVSTLSPRKVIWIENIGLYWHFVDIVWIFLYPLLYLLGRTP